MCCGGGGGGKRRGGTEPPFATGPMRSVPSMRQSSCRKKATARQTATQLQGVVANIRSKRQEENLAMISQKAGRQQLADQVNSRRFGNAWDQSFYGSSNGFRKGKSKQTASMGSDTSRRGINGSFESFQGYSWR
ncbi:hypothetical protein DER46DRAFT_645934 [Fusarium sp. MPI-SDFR-AT-0072]|nr:hypothetical protein DER46DRAFT_645934 [Fusarium sp. MPI-SDFR-AT-0072]